MPRRSSPVLAEAAAVASELGLDLGGHRSTSVASHDLSDVDLVVGFEFRHVAAAVVEGRAPASKAFLLKELVRLVRELPPPPDADPLVRARALLERADGLRRTSEHVLGEEIRDPAGRRLTAFRDIVLEVVETCDEMTALLFGSVSRTRR